MKKGKKMSTAALLYGMSAMIWLVLAGMNLSKGQPVYALVNFALVVICLIFAKRRHDEK